MKLKIVAGLSGLIMVLVVGLGLPRSGWARVIEYRDTEVEISITPGEPTRIAFPGRVQGGSRRKESALFIDDPTHNELILTASEGLPTGGEALIVSLRDGRAYSIRIVPSDENRPRDAVVTIQDRRGADQEEDEVTKRQKTFQQAPASTISGLMREMILAMEFGKAAVPGYRISDTHNGQVLLDDGALQATIERIFLGPNLWGYVIAANNLLDQTQQINPATFRIDGTRAISAQNWELAPRPLTVEQQAAGRHQSKIYVITKARN